ncbi:unnamed protein product [Tenebrio molitor]|nr:unnamed protein product [Tenebrio molitor]
MSKCIVLLYLFVCFVEKTYSLMCYTSDVNSYLSSNNTEHLKHKLQKCSDYVMAMHSSKTPKDSELHCYTISTDYPEIALKGCFPKGICDKLKKTFKDIIGTKNIVTFDIVGGIECNECDKDQCNWGSGFIPSYNSTANSALPTILETLSTAASATINSTHDDDPTLLKCYFCSEPCDTSTALKSSCELSVEGVCTVEVPKGSS